jgi:hypothetical protein
MDPLTEIKHFLLRALLRLRGIPWHQEALAEAARSALAPQPLLSDLRQACRELEAGGFIQGLRDELDGSVSWTLTEKGRHKALQLG